MNRLLKSYTVAVQHPDVSPFEHLEMLMMRDRLAVQESSLSVQEQESLTEADQRLLESAAIFHAELNRIISLEEERNQRQPPPGHWWWYLDVISALPLQDRPSQFLMPA